MAGRNIKNNADWFSHDADASSDEKVVYLESVFGHTGYAVYFKFLECMTRSDGFKLQWNDIKKAIYASKFGISVTEMDRFITECCRQEVKAFEIESGYIFSPGLIKRLEPLLSKREYNRQKYQEQKQAVEEKQDNGSISVTEMTQSKVKERKEYNNTQKRVVDYLNKKTNSQFKPTTKTTKQHIDARLKEGFEPEDFKTVIDFKCSEWIGDPKMQQYLRPTTLFSSNFESYLEAAKRSKKPTNNTPRKTPEQIQKEMQEALS